MRLPPRNLSGTAGIVKTRLVSKQFETGLLFFAKREENEMKLEKRKLLVVLLSRRFFK